MSGRCSHLARLSSTEQKHLNLVFCHDAVLFELALDLVISYDGAERVSFGDRGERNRENTDWL